MVAGVNALDDHVGTGPGGRKPRPALMCQVVLFEAPVGAAALAYPSGASHDARRNDGHPGRTAVIRGSGGPGIPESARPLNRPVMGEGNCKGGGWRDPA